MTANINRYAYINFSEKPYIYYHGIKYNKLNTNQQNYVEPERTIIVMNQPKQIPIINSAMYQNHPNMYDDASKY